MNSDKEPEKYLQLIVKHFVDDAIHGELDQNSIDIFIDELCTNHRFNFVAGHENEKNEIYERLIENDTEWISESLVDKWNCLLVLNSTFTEFESKQTAKIQAVIAEYWNSSVLPGKLDDILTAIEESSDYKLLGEESLLWIEEVRDCVESHKCGVISILNDYLEPRLTLD